MAVVGDGRMSYCIFINWYVDFWSSIGICGKFEESYSQQMSQSEKGHSVLCFKIFLHAAAQVAQWYTLWFDNK